MRAHGKHILLACSYLLFCNLSGHGAQTGGGAAAKDAAAHFRLTHAVSGSTGSQKNGSFVVEDPRSIFSITQDRQVIVYCEFEGPLGMHRIEGFWKNPSGKVVTISDFHYESRERRFSSYFTLALLDSAETGTWSLEARIDGETVGAPTFQILAGVAPSTMAPKKRPLLPAEMYRHLSDSTVAIETLSRYGEVLSLGSGFVAAPGIVVTSYRAVDGAAKMRVRFSDGRLLETDRIASWNMDQDWAAAQIDTGSIAPIPFMETNSWDVGDTVSFLDFALAGNRVISESTIVGKNAQGTAKERLSFAHSASHKAVGGPLLNRYGEAVGIIGNQNASIYREPSILVAAKGAARNQIPSGSTLGIPAILIPFQETNATDLGNLNRNRHSYPPLTAFRYVQYCQLTHRIDHSTGTALPLDSANAFARRDGKMAVFVRWDPKEQMKTSAFFQIYDANDTPVTPPGKFKESKLNFRTGQRASSYWEWKIADMPIGHYRIDILLANEPAARAFFKIE